MNYLMQCADCGATQWVSGHYDADTNALCLADDVPDEWDGGRPDCEHDDLESIDEEADDLF